MISKEENGDNIPKREIVNFNLIYRNFANNGDQHVRRVLYPPVSINLLGQLFHQSLVRVP